MCKSRLYDWEGRQHEDSVPSTLSRPVIKKLMKINKVPCLCVCCTCSWDQAIQGYKRYDRIWVKQAIQDELSNVARTAPTKK